MHFVNLSKFTLHDWMKYMYVESVLKKALDLSLGRHSPIDFYYYSPKCFLIQSQRTEGPNSRELEKILYHSNSIRPNSPAP